MNGWAALGLLLAIILVFQYLCELGIGRLNRRFAERHAEMLTTQIELDEHIINVIDDLRRFQPENSEILEVVALQIRSHNETMRNQQTALKIESTKLPFWIQLAPLSVVTARQLKQIPGQRRRCREMKGFLQTDDGTGGDVDSA